jgi:hypothetical protein
MNASEFCNPDVIVIESHDGLTEPSLSPIGARP